MVRRSNATMLALGMEPAPRRNSRATDSGTSRVAVDLFCRFEQLRFRGNLVFQLLGNNISLVAQARLFLVELEIHPDNSDGLSAHVERKGHIVASAFLFNRRLACFHDGELPLVAFVAHFLYVRGRDGSAIVPIRGSCS